MWTESNWGPLHWRCGTRICLVPWRELVPRSISRQGIRWHSAAVCGDCRVEHATLVDIRGRAGTWLDSDPWSADMLSRLLADVFRRGDCPLDGIESRRVSSAAAGAGGQGRGRLGPRQDRAVRLLEDPF